MREGIISLLHSGEMSRHNFRNHKLEKKKKKKIHVVYLLGKLKF